ncbi:MAG: hypothetical protein JWO25_959 [Alphaproteobacteria bacterium]|nr:hypothetical protein [Alphaproteobacteria bacterium]
MKTGWKLTELFSVYELTAGTYLIAHALILGALVIGIVTGFDWRSLTLFLLAAPFVVAADVVFCCPHCGKSPMRIGLTNRTDDLGDFLSVWRSWPERECSRCGEPLDGL